LSSPADILHGSGSVGETAEPIPVRDPTTGERIGLVPSHSRAEVAEVVRRARSAQLAWAEMPVRERRRALRRARRSFVRSRHEIVDLLARETGKPLTDVVGEALAVCLDVRAACRYAPAALETQRLRRWLPLVKQRVVRWVPHGVVGVIGPWNAPLTLALGDAIYALVAGNAVVVKPSEVTPLAVRRAVELMSHQLPEGLLQVVTGPASTGEALVDHVDMVCVTGSPATGRKVMERASRRLVPVLLELGGKDAMIVLEDANLERAANAAVWGGFFMAGQVCMSIERVLVVDSVADDFIRRVVDKVRKLRVGSNHGEVDLGPLTFAPQVDIIERQIADAIREGAAVRAGGGRLHELGGQFFAPTVLTDVRAEMRVMQEETFGPVVAIMRVADADAAVACANASPFGLNASVWTSDLRRGIAIAERLETGSACVNDCILNAGDPELPFGGVKQSGIGRRHGGVDGVRAFTRPQAIRIDRGRKARDLPWFPYHRSTASFALRAMGWIWR
jgi:acyl-CoA reductase-like NAD-dependent aldehyde dehydrogenase